MAYTAVHRYARISARKVRPLATMVRGKLAVDALDILKYQPERGARLLEKVIRSAQANAEDRQVQNANRLYVAEVAIDEGPQIKRVQPRSRGQACVIKRRMAHIRVALEEI